LVVGIDDVWLRGFDMILFDVAVDLKLSLVGVTSVVPQQIPLALWQIRQNQSVIVPCRL